MKKKLLLQDLSDYIAQQEGISKKDAETFTRAFFEVIEQGLLEDKFVKIKGFGTFKLVSVSERESVNINTGERFQISGHTKISFTPDNYMKELVNRPFAHFETVDLSDDTDTSEFDSIDLEMERNEAFLDDDSEDEEVENVNKELTPAIPETTASSPAVQTENGLQENKDEAKKETAEETPVVAGNAMPSETDTHPDTVQEIQSNVTDNEQPSQDKAETQVHSETSGIAPTTIVPESEDHSSKSEITARIKIDDSDDELENGKENEDSESPSFTEKPEITEKPVEEIVVTSPQTITPNSGGCTSSTMGYSYCEVPSRRKVNWWKRAVIIFGIFILMALSYIVGYYRLLCPCVFDCETLPATSVQENEAVPADTAKSLPKADADADAKPATTKNDSANVKKPVAPTPAKAVKVEKAENTEKAQPKQQELKKEKTTQNPTNKKEKAEQPKQPKIHVVRVGDNLSKISRRYYGSDAYVQKILKYNNLKDANNIPLGMKLRLP